MPHIDVNTREAGRQFRLFTSFLGGEAEVRAQLARVERELQAEKPNEGYTRYWLEPRRRWWLGLGEALDVDRDGLSFRHRVTGNVALTLDTAVKIARLHPTIPDFKRKEFRERLMGGDLDPTPTLLEINVAAHYWAAGFEIEWYEPRAKEGVRTPEFIAKGNDYEIEIECRAKTIDSGRSVERPAFYRLYDEVAPALVDVGASGWVDVVVDGRMPVAQSWREQLRDHLLDRSNWDGTSAIVGGEGTRVAVALQADDSVRARPEQLAAEATRLQEGFAHTAVVARRGDDDAAVNPAFIRARSEKLDQVLNSIHKDLRDKKGQFSGDHPGVLCCYLPEIDSFDGLETGPLANMTLDFFTKHAPTYIVGVSYLADAQVVPQMVPGGVAYASTSPSLDFSNPRFDVGRYGPVRMPGAEG